MNVNNRAKPWVLAPGLKLRADLKHCFISI
jgi:hypothetical protein